MTPVPLAKKVARPGRRLSPWPRQRRQQPSDGPLGSSPPERTRRTRSVPSPPESLSAGSSAAGLPSLETTAGSSQRMPAASSGRQSSASERSQVLDGEMATASQSRAGPLWLRLSAPGPTLHRLCDDRPSLRAELAGATPVLGGRESRCRLLTLQLR